MLDVRNEIINCEKCLSLGIDYINERRENLEYAYTYKPEKITILWIVESPPYIHPDENPRYFYRLELTRYDGLFREVMKALHITPYNPKNDSLDKFKNGGHFLIDAAKCPVDKDNSHLKSQILNNCSEILKQEIIGLNPEKILIVKATLHGHVLSIIKKIDFENRVLNKESIPFPGTGQQKRFRDAVSKYLLSDPLEIHETKSKNITQEKPMESITSNGIPFIIDNITEKDFRKKQMRILVENKSHFPREVRGEPKTYQVKIYYRDKGYNSSYTIGSKDGKSRSGILKIDSLLYMNELRIRPGSIIKMTYMGNDKYSIVKQR
ncbi:hypothetical protein ACFL6I_18105 [candidate division KSB1 bacterium]